MPYDRRFDDLLRFHFGAESNWAEALMMVETGGNEYALGDNGLGHGLFQLHPDFWADWGGMAGTPYAAVAIWLPALQVAAVARFWQAHRDLTPQQRCLIFHYGPAGHLKHADDPDGYLKRVDDWL